MVVTSNGTVAVFFARPIVRLLTGLGHDPDEFLREHGLTRAEVLAGEGRIDASVGVEIIDSLAKKLGDPVLGISLARYADYASFGALGVAAAAGGRLRDVLALCARYSDVVTDAIDVTVTDRENAIVLEVVERPGASPHPQSMLLTLAVVRVLARSRVRGARPTRVVVRELSADGIVAAESYFECPVETGTTYRIEYPNDSGAAVMSGSDVVVAAAVEKVLGARFESRGRSTTDALARFVEANLGSGEEPSLDDAATALGTTPRSLQRRLKAEDSTWQRIVDDTRRKLAADYVRDSTLSFTEVSYRLGFADLSSFSRSFRKWYGTSASDYRSTAGAGGARKSPRSPR